MPYLITADQSEVREEIERSAAELVKFTMRRAWSYLTAPPSAGGTPRLTGFASASWIISVGVPSSKVAGSKENVDRGPGREGLESLRAYTLEKGAVFISNNTEYIHILNARGGKKVGPGFVDSAWARALNDASKEGLR